MFNQFAAGKKVYGQGSYAPTRGQVNPAGYIQREVKNRLHKNGGVSKVGGDGQSDTRSGLAKTALNRQQEKRPQNPGTQVISTQAPVGVAPMNVSPTGQLQLPYSSEFAGQALDAQQAFDSQLLDLQQAEQAQRMGFEQNTRDLEQGYTTQKRGTLNDNASRGVLRSSAYGTAVNADGRNYLNAKNDMELQNTTALNNIAQQRTAAQTMFNQILQRLNLAHAEGLSEDAGGLGFGISQPRGGQPKAPKVKPKAPHIPKPKSGKKKKK